MYIMHIHVKNEEFGINSKLLTWHSLYKHT